MRKVFVMMIAICYMLSSVVFGAYVTKDMSVMYTKEEREALNEISRDLTECPKVVRIKTEGKLDQFLHRINTEQEELISRVLPAEMDRIFELTGLTKDSKMIELKSKAQESLLRLGYHVDVDSEEFLDFAEEIGTKYGTMQIELEVAKSDDFQIAMLYIEPYRRNVEKSKAGEEPLFDWDETIYEANKRAALSSFAESTLNSILSETLGELERYDNSGNNYDETTSDEM